MKRILGFVAIATGLCAWPIAASATLIGDQVTFGHYTPDTSTLSGIIGVYPSATTTVAEGDSDQTTVYFSYPYTYLIDTEADSIYVDYSYLIIPGDSGTWWNTSTSCQWNGDFTSFDCVDVPVAFNGLRVSDLDDSSGNPLVNVTVDTNMAGWDNSRLSFGADDVWFNWAGLSFDSGTYLNAQLEFGGGNGSAQVPEPATLLLLGGGMAMFAAMRKKLGRRA